MCPGLTQLTASETTTCKHLAHLEHAVSTDLTIYTKLMKEDNILLMMKHAKFYKYYNQ